MKRILLILLSIILLTISFLIIKINISNKLYANAPSLASGMIPVYYDNENKVWRKSSIQNKNNNWYDYNSGKWANAIMVNKEKNNSNENSKSRNEYIASPTNTVILYSDILAFYVWIPRYKYKIFNTDFEKIDPQPIDIIFEKGTSSTGTVTCENNSSSETCIDKINGKIENNKSTYTHPAFTFGNIELEGIWVSKFETTGTSEEPTVLPNSIALTNQSVSEQFLTSKKFEEEKYLDSVALNNTDVHMMKNMEWGVVAYLSNSKYGRCKNNKCEEIYQNNSMGITGRSGGNNPKNIKPINTHYNIDDNSKTVYGYYTYDDRIVNHDGTVGKYINNNLGSKSSTTGNIYGIYDMSGGSNEYTMSVMTYIDGTVVSGLDETKNSGFNGILYNKGNIITKTNGIDMPDKKYYDLYSYSEDANSFNRSKLGDATGETRGWYDDKECLVNALIPWTKRGCSSVGEDKSGLFYFCSVEGQALSHISFRTVISVK